MNYEQANKMINDYIEHLEKIDGKSLSDAIIINLFKSIAREILTEGMPIENLSTALKAMIIT